MARPLRIELAGGLYHITARGDRSEDIFLDDSDRLHWITLLGSVCRRFNWRCHAWCQMTNHYHLVVETPEANLAQGMRQINGVYTQYVNRQHQRVGHVFQGRYKAILVERDAHLLEVSRYVVLNPVRAGMTATPGDWPWSSWHAMVGSHTAPAWLDTHWLLDQFSGTPEHARQAYIDFVNAGIGRPGPWQALSGQIYLGSDDFIREALAATAGALDRPEIPRAQRRAPAKPLERYRDDAPDRDTGIRAAFASGDYTQQQIGRCFGVHYATVSRIVKRGESGGE